MRSFQRFLVVGLAALLGALGSSPQEPKPSPREDNVYAMALFASLTEMEKSWGDIDDSEKGERVRTNYRDVVAEKNSGLTDMLPTQRGDYRVQFLDSQEQIARFKKLGKEYALLEIRPISNEGPILRTTIPVYYVSYRKGRLMHALSDWSTVDFRYDCDRQEFVVSKVTLGGI